jgi:hypothetical protein
VTRTDRKVVAVFWTIYLAAFAVASSIAYSGGSFHWLSNKGCHDCPVPTGAPDPGLKP